MLLLYVHETLAIALDSHMYAEDRPAPIIASVHNIDTESSKRLGSHTEVVNYFLKKYVSDQARATYDTAVLRNIPAGNMSFQQYTKDLATKSCKVADF